MSWARAGVFEATTAWVLAFGGILLAWTMYNPHIVMVLTTGAILALGAWLLLQGRLPAWVQTRAHGEDPKKAGFNMIVLGLLLMLPFHGVLPILLLACLLLASGAWLLLRDRGPWWSTLAAAVGVFAITLSPFVQDGIALGWHANQEAWVFLEGPWLEYMVLWVPSTLALAALTLHNEGWGKAWAMAGLALLASLVIAPDTIIGLIEGTGLVIGHPGGIIMLLTLGSLVPPIAWALLDQRDRPPSPGTATG